MNLRFVLLVSLALNAAVVGLLIWKRTSPGSVTQTVNSRSTDFVQNPNPSGTNILRLDWHAVESADYKEYVKNLRVIGCPEETIFDIIVADVNTLYASRSQAVSAGKPWRYWEAADEVPSREEIRNQKLRREMEKEKRDLVIAILGPDATERLRKYQLWGGGISIDRKLAFLPDEKRNQLKLLEEKYFDLEQDASEWDSNGIVTEETMAKLAELRRQRRTEIAALLTPDELENLDLRTSETAESLRQQLRGFSPSEEEFKQLYQSRKALEAVLNSTTDVRDPAVLQARVDAQKQIASGLEATLGPERYADLTRSEDIDYQNTRRLALYFGLPETVASDVYDLKQQDAKQAGQIDTDVNLTDQQRSQIYAGMRDSTEARLKQLLGERVFAEYRRSNRWWMRGL